jgi:hypothetical protein
MKLTPVISILFILLLFSFCTSNDAGSKKQLVLHRQDCVKKQVDAMLPFLQSKDGQTRLISCNFLNALAAQAPIDAAIPMLENISRSDTMSARYMTKSGPGEVSFPVRNAASQALSTNEGRKRLDSVILASSDSLPETIYHYALSLHNLQSPCITYELDHLTWKQKEAALSKLQAHDALELECLLEESSNCNYDLFESILEKHIADKNIDAREIVNIRHSHISRVKNPILVEASKNILKSAKINSLEWTSSLDYLCGIRDYDAVMYLIPLLNDTTTQPIPALTQQTLRQTDVLPRQYRVRTTVYEYLRYFYDLPRYYTKEEVEIACTIFDSLWKAALRDEAQKNLGSEPAGVIK